MIIYELMLFQLYNLTYYQSPFLVTYKPSYGSNCHHSLKSQEILSPSLYGETGFWCKTVMITTAGVKPYLPGNSGEAPFLLSSWSKLEA